MQASEMIRAIEISEEELLNKFCNIFYEDFKRLPMHAAGKNQQ